METPLARHATWIAAAVLLALTAAWAPVVSRASVRRGGERLLLAIPVDGLAPPPTLAGHLHLADPAATIVVALPGDAPSTAGPFTIEVVDGAVAISRIPATEGDLLVVPLDAQAAGPAGAFDPIDGMTPIPSGTMVIVEVLAGPDGVAAHRVGDLVPASDELRLPAWRLPEPGVDAVMLDHAWWTLGPGPAPAMAHPDRAHRARLRHLRDRLIDGRIQESRRVTDLSIGDVTGDGNPDLAVAFRRPFRTTFLNAGAPDAHWQDADGLSAHVGLLRPGDLTSIWVAGTVVTPVARLAACDGALAVVHDSLDDTRIVAGGAWDWEGFGFQPLPELPGPGTPVCIDIDRDGRSDPAIVERS